MEEGGHVVRGQETKRQTGLYSAFSLPVQVLFDVVGCEFPR